MIIFIPETNKGETVFISGDDARHLFSHRPQPGEKILCSDGKNFSYSGKISQIKRDGLFIEIENKTPIEKRKTEITLFQAFLKGDKNEFIIQKTTELGIDRIVFFSSENCISKIDENKKSAKKERFEKIAKQAAMQCGRNILPVICDFIDFDRIIPEAKERNGIFFYENALKNGAPLLSEYLHEKNIEQNFSFIVGPEGGFSEKEAKKAGKILETVSLGKRILRAETVPVAVLAVISAKIGEI